MNFNVEISSSVDETEWNNRLLKSNAASTYQTSNWARIYSESFDSKPVFIRVTDGTGETVAQLVALIHKKFLWAGTNIVSQFIGLKLNLQSLFTWNYGPIIFDDSNQNEITSKILDSVDKIALQNNVTMIRGTPSPLANQLPTVLFHNHAYELVPWATYITDLRQNIDDLYNSFDKKTRYDIRKTEEQGFEFEVVNDRSSLTEFEELKYQEKKRAGKKAFRYPFFLDAHWKYLHKNGLEKLFFVRYNGEPIGAILNVIFNGNIVQHGVVNSEKKHLQGGSFLTWNILKWAIKTKHLTYNMGGVHPFPDSEKEKKIYFYKSKWGGRQFDYLQYTKTFNKTKIKISKAMLQPKRVPKEIHKIIHNIHT